MTTRRQLIIALAASASAVPLAPLAQQAGKVHRVGYMSAQTRAIDTTRIEAFRQGLRELGYIEGRNIAIEFRWADGKYERLPELAAELVRLKVDVIISVGTPATLAAQKATRAIPIVFPLSGDPIRTGIVSSLARPGGNITGFTSLTGELSQKRLELLKEVVPRLSDVAVISNPTNPVHGPALSDLKNAAVALRLQLQFLEVKRPDEFESAFSALGKTRSQALFFLPDEMFNTQRGRVVDLVIKNRVPASFYASEWAEDGGLMFYGAHIADLFRRAAIYVDKLAKGAKPGDLPVEQPIKFELIINLKTAKQIGLTISPSVLARADRVIE